MKSTIIKPLSYIISCAAVMIRNTDLYDLVLIILFFFILFLTDRLQDYEHNEEHKAMELIKEAQDRWEKHLETTNSLCNIKKEDNEKLH